MGGNLFKLGRRPKAEYKQIEKVFIDYLQTKTQGHFRIPKYYGDKADFGDLDLLISADAPGADRWVELRMEFVQELGIQQYKAAGKVFSTVYDNFQVDFFLTDPRYFESTYHYLCYNDIGNLIGKICRRFNLKYGERGLEYVFRRADGHYQKDLPVCRDWEKIYGFLGLDFATWKAGFPHREAMFEWVIASPYFSVKPYLKLSKSMEKRANQRTTIQSFLQYLEEKGITKTFDFAEDRDEYLPMIAAYFPEADLLTALAEEKRKEELAIRVKTKYNGRIVMELIPELKGKALGTFMQHFQVSFGDYRAEIVEMSATEVRERILACWRTYEPV